MLIEFRQDAFQHDQVFLIQNPDAGASREYDLYHSSGKFIRELSADDAVTLVQMIRDAQATRDQEIAALTVVTHNRVQRGT